MKTKLLSIIRKLMPLCLVAILFVSVLPAEAATVTITLSGFSMPSSFNYGATGIVKGAVISTGQPLKDVTAKITSSDGKTVFYSTSYNPSSTTCPLGTGVIGNALKFNMLKVGSYKLYVTAKTASKTVTLINGRAFTVTSKGVPTISGATKPASEILKGDDFKCKGTISSSYYNLTNVTATIKTSTGTVKYTKSVNPSSKTYKLDNSTLDSAMQFAALATGSYVYTVSATDVAGNTKQLISSSFTVKAVSTLKGSSIGKISTHTLESKFTPSGTVSSNYNIKSVKGIIYDSNGKVIYQKEITPNSKSVSIASSAIATELHFEYLKTGSYHYSLKATDEQKTVTLADCDFTVRPSVTGTKSSNYTVKSGTSTSSKLLYPYLGSMSLKQKDHHEFDRPASEGGGNEGCSVMAYVVGLSIINKKEYDPTKFWSNRNCTWKPSGTTYKNYFLEEYETFSSSSYKKIAEKIAAGLPTVLYYTYPSNGTTGTHFVLVVDIKSGVSAALATKDSLICYDPVYGDVRYLKDCWNFSNSTLGKFKCFKDTAQ